MSQLAKVFELLGEKVMPKIAQQVFPHELNILRVSRISDGGGGTIETRTEDTFTPIPCAYEPKNSGVKDVQSNQWISVAGYKFTLPCFWEGSKVDLKTDDRFEMLAHGATNPSRIFKVVYISSNNGVVFEAFCKIDEPII